MTWNRLSQEPKKNCFNCKYWNCHTDPKMKIGTCEHPNEKGGEKIYTGTCDWFVHYQASYKK